MPRLIDHYKYNVTKVFQNRQLKGYELMGHLGLISKGNDPHREIVFFINFAPDMAEQSVQPNYDLTQMQDQINEQIEFLANVRDMANVLHQYDPQNKIRVQTEFYWSEQELLVRIGVPLSHPIFDKIRE